MLDKTLGYILCCQSPALFLAALALLVAYLAGRKHRVKAFFRLLLCILCAAGAVALYFLGIYKEYFTIRDFFHIRPAGWVGLVIAAVIVVLTAVRAFFAAADARREQKAAARRSQILYKPSSEEVFRAIIPEYVAGIVYGAVCESVASELAARRTAMDAATKNAGEMIDHLNLYYNRARQAAITQEITEIVAGAEI